MNWLRQKGQMIAVALMLVAGSATILALATGRVSLLRPDQQAYRDFVQSNFAEAAGKFTDPRWQGVALFRAGKFARSAGVFAGFDTAESAFNHGNALLMQGNYDEAATRYARALELKPGFEDAAINRDIALGRAARLRQEGGDMTGGMLGADDIVFTTQKSPPSAGEEQTEGGQPMSDAEQRAVWLRRLQTRPADFLAAKFAYQYAVRPPDDADTEAAQ